MYYNLLCVLRRHSPAADSPLQRQPAAESHLRLGVSFHHVQTALDVLIWCWRESMTHQPFVDRIYSMLLP